MFTPIYSSPEREKERKYPESDFPSESELYNEQNGRRKIEERERERERSLSENFQKHTDRDI